MRQIQMKLDPESMYSFKYDPKGLGTLPQFDKHPLIFILDIQGKYLLAVNTHWIPKTKRSDFIQDVKDIMGKTVGTGKKRERMRLFYTMLKKPKFRIGEMAIRKYIIANISHMVKVPKTKWDYLLGISKYWEDVRYKDEDYKSKIKDKSKPFLK